MVPTDGFEPPTYGLLISCSTSWAMWALSGWGAWIRTTIGGIKIRSPTFRRHPNVLLDPWNGFEPLPKESESFVLPLNYQGKLKTQWYIANPSSYEQGILSIPLRLNIFSLLLISDLFCPAFKNWPLIGDQLSPIARFYNLCYLHRLHP